MPSGLLLPCRSSLQLLVVAVSCWILLLSAAAAAATNNNNNVLVKVEFYGEALCPFCRKFVTTAWPSVWNDAQLRLLVDDTMVPWGNAYFPTRQCGGEPFSHETMACWFQHCVQTLSADNDDDCFAGKPVHQHGAIEGILDQYETCVLHELGLEAGVAFAVCVEGPNLERYQNDATALVAACLDDSLIDAMQHCVETQGRDLEILNAKQTPGHAGVPYVLVNGVPLQDPLQIKAAVCQALAEESIRPASCSSSNNNNNEMDSNSATYYLRTVNEERPQLR